jgi:hypothetical protein
MLKIALCFSSEYRAIIFLALSSLRSKAVRMLVIISSPIVRMTASNLSISIASSASFCVESIFIACVT